MRIELEVTLRCNAKCPHCDRHCDILSQPETDMTKKQIMHFCEEVREHGNVDLVSVLGGEPSLHPDIEHILLMLSTLKSAGHIGRLIYATNGSLPLPEGVGEDYKVFTNPVCEKHHHRFDISPSESGLLYEAPCAIPGGCGIALNCFGYWPCGAGGAISRLLGIPDMARYSLSEASGWDYDRVCRHCAHGCVLKYPVTDYATPASPIFVAARKGWTKYNGRRY